MQQMERKKKWWGLGWKSRTGNHHLICERCEEGRIADVAEETKEKEEKKKER
jgi:hypothetical protein